MKSPEDAILSSLRRYLQNNVSGIKKVYAQWPYPNQMLEYPCISLLVASPEFINHPPQQFSITDIGNNKLKVLYHTGQYNMTIQVDIWVSNKTDRSKFFTNLDQAINKEFLKNDSPRGLSLKLKDYYDEIARYEQTGYQYLDNADSAVKGEWRVKVDLVVNFRKVDKAIRAKISQMTLESEIENVTETIII